MDIFCREVQPFVPLTLQEIRFWLHIMKEHSVLIKLGLPGEQKELKAQAQHLYECFAELLRRSGYIRSDHDFHCLVDMAAAEVERIFGFKRHILQQLLGCRLGGGCLYPLLLDHMSREALYFFKLLKKIQPLPPAYPADAILTENIFWLRLMADHLKFTRDLVDPSERVLVAEAGLLGEKLDQMNLQARDQAGMLWHYCPTNELIRFEKDVNQTACLLREFMIAAEGLTKDCAALSLITPLLAAHLRCETEHFLEVIKLVRAGLMNLGPTLISDHDSET